MNIAVIGLGGIGRRHLRNFLALDCTVFPYDITSDVYTLEQALDRADGVVIATPPDSHAEIARQTDKPLLVEKPIALTVEDAQWIADRSVCLVGYQWRYDAGMLAKHAEAIALGPLTYISTRYGYDGASSTPQAMATAQKMGAILDCSHAIDYLRWIAGHIVAVQGCVIKDGLEADLVLRFASGASGYADLWLNRPLKCAWVAGTAERRAVFWQRPLDSPNTDAMYREEARHFLRCITGEARPMTDGFDAIETLRVCLAAQTAAREQRWVTL